MLIDDVASMLRITRRIDCIMFKAALLDLMGAPMLAGGVPMVA